MPFKIEHKTSVTASLTATNSASTSARIPWSANAGGMVFVTAVDSGATTITWYAASDPEAPPVPVIDGGNNVTTTIASGRAYYIPDSLFAAPFIMPVTNAGTATLTVSAKG